MDYKKSEFNIFVPDGDKTIIFNSYSGSIGEFDNEHIKKYDSDAFTEEEIKLLVDKGIYVPASFDEKKAMLEDRTKQNTKKNEKFIRLWTTSACNARCFYCFEKGMKAVNMTKKTAKQLVKYISGALKEGDTVTFEWFGGEPLLNREIIDYIIKTLNPICEEKGCKTQSFFISNGSLIDEEIAEQMKNDWNTKSIQITIDGFKDDYNRIKDYYNPKRFHFEKVIKNIKLLSNKGIHVAIRMNYGTDNYDSLMALIEYLKEELSECVDVTYYLYPLWDSIDHTYKDAFKSNAVADKKLIHLFDKLVDAKMATPRSLARLNYKKGQCKASNEASFAVFPDGKIGKCSESFLQVIGDVWKGIEDKDIFDIWVDPKVSDECNECKMLPLCQGGCKSSNFTSMPKCSPFKDIIRIGRAAWRNSSPPQTRKKKWPNRAACPTRLR